MGKIHLENVCNIKSADIDIVDGKLNIKFGTNGTGKSSIVKAIRAASLPEGKEKDKEIELIRPYHLKDVTPVIETDYSNIKLFDLSYVDNFLFEKDSLYKNSYSIIINNSDTKELREEIEKKLEMGVYTDVITRLTNIKKTFTDNIKWNKDSNKDGIIPAKYALSGIRDGNVRKQYEEQTPYNNIVSKKSWIEFAKLGQQLRENTHQCPYCLKEMDDNEVEELDKVINFFDNNNIDKYLESIDFVNNNIYRYMDKNEIDEFQSILDKKEKVSKEDAAILKNKIDKIQKEFNKLDIINDLRNISLLDINNIMRAKDSISDAYLDTDIFVDVEDLKMATKYNEYVNEIEKSINDLYNLNLELNNKLKLTIENNKEFINRFLQNSGMKYRVDINDQQRIVLRPLINSDEIITISSPKDHLSYGERNSLSLMLFALEIKNSEHDLIVLDDPISSFDINKKFAIFYQLFDKNDGEFKDDTVLMLTHEFSVVIDALKSNMFDNVLPTMRNGYEHFVRFIKNTNGEIEEKMITKRNIKSSEALDKEIAQNKDKSRIVRACHIRRFIEMNYFEYPTKYNLISSFLHCLKNPLDYDGNKISVEEIKTAQDEINKIMEINNDPFDYYLWMEDITKEKLEEEFAHATYSTDKIFLTRFYSFFLQENHLGNNNMINQSLYSFLCSNYHIENESVMKLTDKFDTIPAFIIEACEEFFRLNK